MEQSDKRFKELREDINKRFEEMGKRFEQIDKRFEQVDKRFEQVDKRFEQFMNFLWIITGIFTTLTSVVIGFAYWDRRTIIRKAKEETLESLEREGKLKNLIEALKELAKEDEKLARVLKQYGLL
jgi:DNA anti-recombination protein RmuC